MKYKTFMVKNTIFFTLLLFLQACGSSPDADKSDQTSSSTQQSMVIDEDNYVKLSQYYFHKQAKFLQTKKSRGTNLHPSYPGANRVSSNKILVTAVTPFDSYVQKMKLSQNDRKVSVIVDTKANKVTISFDGRKNSDVTTMTLEEFQNLDENGAL
jgi:maltose-binding protein MalE